MFKNLFKKSSQTTVIAPLNGKVVPLSDVPDPVFGQKMMGEGIAIIPSEGKVLSPVAGKIVQVPETKHAIGIEANDGTEILIHVGLETVALKGNGFDAKVAAGDKVEVGDLLMEFDLEYVRKTAENIVTPVIVTNTNQEEKNYTLVEEGEAVAGTTEVITITMK